MAAPDEYVAWVNEHIGFNPRAQEHSDFLTDAIFRDLEAVCPSFREDVDSLRVALKKNRGLGGESYSLTRALKLREALAADRLNIDTNLDGVVLRIVGEPRAPLALENKTVSTAHGKARTNRWKDAREFAGHVHETDRRSIAAFTVLINLAADYENPDEFAQQAKSSGTNREQAARDTIRLFTDGMPMRTDTDQPDIWCEAAYVLVIRYDGRSPAQLVVDDPAPPPGSPYSYDWFRQRLCRLYCDRN